MVFASWGGFVQSKYYGPAAGRLAFILVIPDLFTGLLACTNGRESRASLRAPRYAVANAPMLQVVDMVRG